MATLLDKLQEWTHDRRERRETAQYAEWKRLNDLKIEGAARQGDLSGILDPAMYSGSDTETILRLYEFFVDSYNVNISPYGLELNEFPSKSLEAVLGSSDPSMLKRWATSMLKHAKKEERNGRESDVRYILVIPGSGDTLIEQLVHLGSVEAASYLAGPFDYGGKDRQTLIVLADLQDSGHYAIQMMQTSPYDVSLAKFLLNVFTNADGTPKEKLHDRILHMVLEDNQYVPSRIDDLVNSYLEAYKNAKSWLNIANKVAYLGHGSQESTTSVLDPKLSLNYMFKAAQIALKAADLGEESREKALDKAIYFFELYISGGGPVADVPEMLVEYALSPKNKHQNLDATLLNRFEKNMYNHPKYWGIMEKLFGGDTVFVNIGGSFGGESFDQKPFEHSQTGYSYQTAVAALGLDPTNRYTPQQLKTAYRRAAFKWHPDLNKAPEAEKMIKKFNDAFEFLHDAGYLKDKV